MTWRHLGSLLARRDGDGPSGLDRWIERYAAWVIRHHRRIIGVAAVLAVVSAALAATLPLLTEFSWLLPDQQPSVVALRELTRRRPSSAVIQVGIASPSPEATRRFAADLTRALREKLPPELLREVEADDADLWRFVWQHRHLYASVDDLTRVRDDLQRRIEEEHEKHNPFLVDLDGAPAQDAPGDGRGPLDDVRARIEELRARAEGESGYIGEQGRLRMLVVRCPFGDTEPAKGQVVLEKLDEIVESLRPTSYHPSLEVGYAGDPVTAALEHDLVIRDVALSSALCFVLVMLALLIAVRSTRAVLALCFTLAASCAYTFGLTRLQVGHLNSSTAFLGSVVAGNGINFGIILLWRYLEERRRGREHGQALIVGLRRTGVPTLVAAAAAGTAYLSLTITSFRGFSEFGIIAGSGMVLCWATSYLLLPALLTAIERRRPLVRDLPVETQALKLRAPALGTLFSRLLALSVVALTSGLAVYGALRLSREPFEDDLKTLRSRSYPYSRAGRWSFRMTEAFGRDRSGGFYIGTRRIEDVPVVVRAIREAERDVPPEKRLLGKIDALPLALPGTAEEQQAKIALLGEIRRKALKVRPHLAEGSQEARLVDELLPPESLRVLGDADLPPRLRAAFTEADGRVGLLLSVHPGPAFQNWSFAGIREATELIRSLRLPEEVRSTIQISGAEVIFVDMMEAVERDGPRASVLSLALVLVLLVAAFGIGRDAWVTAFASLVGLFGMLGLMAAFEVRLNFLNYIAVPITIGIGVDYPFNVMARFRQESTVEDPLSGGFWQTAGAVMLCSLTTIIGYAVLLLSDTGAIRSFGAAAVLGEVTSIIGAVVAIPCIIALLARGGRAPGSASTTEPMERRQAE